MDERPPGAAYQHLRHKLLAGLADAGMSSLATFVVGVIAIRTLSTADLGAYSVLFAAFLVGSLVPAEAYFLPRQVTAMKWPPELRLRGIARAIATSFLPGAIGVSVVLLAALAILPASDPALLFPEMIAAMGLVIVSPAQDHLRRCFHLGERSWSATLVSAGQLLGVVTLALAATNLNLATSKLPLTLLLGANCISLILGLALAGRQALGEQIPVDQTVRGRSLLVSSMFIMGGGLLSSVLMTSLAGPEVVGFAEAARTAAQPVLVVAVGLLAALSSRALSAIHERDRAKAERANRLFLGFMGATTVAFMAIFLFEGPRRLVGNLLPAAVAIPGLALASIFGNFLLALSFLWREQLVNGGRERSMVRVDGWAITLPIAAAIAVPWLGAFARSVGLIGQNLYRTIRYRDLWHGLFADSAD